MPYKKLIFLGIISYFLISANLGGYSIYILDEAKNAECAREMLSTGNFIVPMFNGELRTDKPPLHYYFMIISYRLFGVTPFAARFFSVIFGVLTILITYLFCRHFLNERSANFAVLALLSSLGFIIQFHLATPDPYLVFFVTAALFAYFYFEQTEKKKYLYLAYLAVGMGTLSKGPVAIVLPGMSVFCYLLTKRKNLLTEVRKLKPHIGLLIVLITAAPWYVLVHLKTNGAWTHGFFVDHNINRYAEPREGHGGSFLVPLLFFCGMFLPFAVFLPQIIYKSWKNRKSDVVAFCSITTLAVLLFFSLSGTKLPSYISPAFAFAAILAGGYLDQLKSTQKLGWGLSLGFIFLIGMGGIFSAFSLLKANGILAGLNHLAWYFAVIPLTAIIGLILLLFKQKFKAGISVSFGFIIFHQCFFYFMFPKIDERNPVSSTIPLVQKEEPLAYYKSLNPAYVFSRKAIIPKLTAPSGVLDFIQSSDNAVIISHPRYENELNVIPGLKVVARRQDLFDTYHTLLLRYQTETSPSSYNPEKD